jgi:hypothetical protein
MYSSPVRRFTSVLLHLLARLACIRRAASVRSEPGSNSHKDSTELDPRVTSSIHLTHFSLYSVVKEPIAFITRAAHFTTRSWPCQEVQKIFFDLDFLRIRRGAYNRIGHKAGSNVRFYTNPTFQSQALHSSFYYRRVFTWKIGSR